MKVKSLVRTVALSTVTSLIFVGCGGGSSGGTDTSNTQSLSGNVADGYLVGAKVCLDKNGNSKCDSDEPVATTGAKGKYTISNLTANDINTYPLLVEVDELVVDEDDNQTVGEYYTLKATAGQTFISPISTMIRNYETTNNVTHTVARAAIENLLGIDNVALSVDNYIENNSTEATEVHKKAKIIANMKMQVFQRLGTTAQNYDAKVVDKYIDNIVMGKLGTVKTEVESNVLDLQTNIANVMALVNTSNPTTSLNTIKTQYEQINNTAPITTDVTTENKNFKLTSPSTGLFVIEWKATTFYWTGYSELGMTDYNNVRKEVGPHGYGDNKVATCTNGSANQYRDGLRGFLCKTTGSIYDDSSFILEYEKEHTIFENGDGAITSTSNSKNLGTIIPHRDGTFTIRYIK